MAGGVNVGTAYLEIIPSAKGFAGKLQTDLGGELATAGKKAGKKAGEEAGKSFHSGFAHTVAHVVEAAGVWEGLKKGSEFLTESVKAASEDQQAQAVLENQIKNTTHATAEQAKGVDEWLTKTSESTGHLKTELIPEFTKLVTATHSTHKAQQLLSLAMNVSAGSGKSLSAVTMALVRAQNGSTAGLSRLGIKTKETVKDQGALTKANDAVAVAQQKLTLEVHKHGVHSAQAQAAAAKLTKAHENLAAAQGKTKQTTISFTQAQKLMTQEFKGAQAAASDTAAGKMKRLGAIWEEAKVSLGNFLIPILSKLAGIVVKEVVPAVEVAVAWFKENLKPELDKLVPLIGAKLVPMISNLGHVLSVVGAWMMNNKSTVLTFVGVLVTVVAVVKAWEIAQAALDIVLNANPIGIIVVALAALAAGLVYAWTHFKGFRDVVTEVFNWIKDHWKLLVPILLTVFFGPLGFVIGIVITHFGAFKKAGEEAFDAIATVAKWMWNNVLEPVFKFLVGAMAWVMDQWGTMLGALSHVPGFGWAKTAANAMHDAAGKARELGDSMNKIPDRKSVSVDVAMKFTKTNLDSIIAKQANDPRLVGHNAQGTNYWRGGPTWVGENGPEIVDVSRGARIIPNHKITAMPAAAAHERSGTQEMRGVLTIDRDGMAYIRGVVRDEMRGATAAHRINAGGGGVVWP